MTHRNLWEEREVEEFYNDQEIPDSHLLLLEDDEMGAEFELFDDELEELLNEIEVKNLVPKI